MYNVLYIQKTHHDLFLSGPILHRKCSVRNKMFGFALALNLNPHSGSCSVVLLNLTPNIMFGSGSNIVRNVRNRTVASLLQAIIRKPDQFCSRPVFRRTLQTLRKGQSRYFSLQISRIRQMFYLRKVWSFEWQVLGKGQRSIGIVWTREKNKWERWLWQWKKY